MPDSAPQPVKRVPARGKRKGHWGCFEWWKLRTELLFAGAVQLVLIVAELVADPNLSVVLTTYGSKAVLALALVGAIRGYILKHQDNTGKQA